MKKIIVRDDHSKLVTVKANNFINILFSKSRSITTFTISRINLPTRRAAADAHTLP